MPYKRKNPKTPASRKRTTKKSRNAGASDVHLPGGALQTTFRVEAQPATMVSTPAPVDRTVHFSPNVTTLAGGSEALGQHLGHQSDSNDPFIVSGNNATTGSSRMFSSNIQNDEDFDLNVSPSPLQNRGSRSQNAPLSPTPSRQHHEEFRASGPARNRRAQSTADLNPFFQIDSDNKKRCRFCLSDSETNSALSVFAYGRKTSTTTLRKHLYSNHIKEWLAECKRLDVTITAKDALEAIAAYQGITLESQTQPRPQFSQAKFINALAEFIVATDQPVSIVDAKEFRSLLLLLRENLDDKDIPHRTTMTKRILELRDEQINHMSTQMLQTSMGKISFTMDLWTDINMKAYMAVTAHWLQQVSLQQSEMLQSKLSLRTDLIGFVHVPGSHTGERLAKVFLYIIDRLDISKKIGWITMDNASNNNTFISALQASLSLRGIQFSGSTQRIRCFPHIVNLACKAMIHNMAGLVPQHDSIKNLRNVIQNIRISSGRRDAFAGTFEKLRRPPVQLIRDVDTRWSSTFLMIKRAIELREVIDEYLSEHESNSDNKLTEDDWTRLTKIQTILRFPHSYQEILSAETTPTLWGTLPAFEGLLTQLKAHQTTDMYAYNIIEDGVQKLEEYQEETDNVPAYTLSILLNPVARLQWFRNYRPTSIDLIRSTLIDALEPYYVPPNTDRAPEPHVRTRHAKSQKMQAAFKNLGINFSQPTGSGTQTLNAEVDNYLAGNVTVDMDCISFWEENQNRFPTLFKLAMDIIPVQASSVPCERVFSSSKETITARRNSLSPHLVEALQLLKYGTKKGRGISFVEGLDQTEELAELETREQGQPVEDLIGYFHNFQK